MTPYRQAIVIAAQAGIPPRWIAYEMGTTRNAIKSILSQERARGEVIPRFRPGPQSVAVTSGNEPPKRVRPNRGGSAYQGAAA